MWRTPSVWTSHGAILLKRQLHGRVFNWNFVPIVIGYKDDHGIEIRSWQSKVEMCRKHLWDDPTLLVLDENDPEKGGLSLAHRVGFHNVCVHVEIQDLFLKGRNHG